MATAVFAVGLGMGAALTLYDALVQRPPVAVDSVGRKQRS